MTESTEGRPPTTTDAGIPVASQEHSLTIGPTARSSSRTSTCMEQMANFNRERIPERQPHAKGGGAFGTFTVSNDVSRYTKAAVFQPGTKTELVIRFSTVAGERGSPDTWRDPRGFAIKFYTSEGNFDMVGNNTPVFFIRDPLKFQNFIRSQKRLAANNLRSADMQWDFWTLSPESAHMVTWLMGDRGIPKSWRHMNGYSSHTYMWVNAGGRAVLGQVPLQDRPGGRVPHAGGRRSHRRRGRRLSPAGPLFNAIEQGEFPSWTLKMQIMPFDAAKSYRFNPFDLTKVWPHDDYPLIEVGKLVLNRNVTDYHTEMEQAAFQPNNTVPGTGLSPDKMLLARGFSYADAHRARLGCQLPADPGEPTRRSRYGPTQRTEPCGSRTRPTRSTTPIRSKVAPRPTNHTTPSGAVWAADGEMVRAAYTRHTEDDDFGQANTLINDVLDDAGRDRLVDNVAGHAAAVNREDILQRVFDYWRNIDKSIGDQIEAACLQKRKSGGENKLLH